MVNIKRNSRLLLSINRMVPFNSMKRVVQMYDEAATISKRQPKIVPRRSDSLGLSCTDVVRHWVRIMDFSRGI